MDITIRFAQDIDKEELVRIWQICFGDPVSYIHFFMDNCFNAQNTIVACSEGKVVGVTYMLPANLQEQKFMYGYAVGVIPEYRGNHICEMMHSFIKEYAEKEGFMYGLHPANIKLFSFYRRIGLRDMYSLRRYETTKVPVFDEFVMKDITNAEYASLRNQSFAPLVEWSDWMMAYILLETKTYSGFVKKIIVEEKERILCGKQYHENVIIQETTLTDEEIKKVFPFLHSYFGAEKITFILPNSSALGKVEESVLGFGEKNDNIYMNLFLD